ncbi:unnamed protein product [Choristocarpus tenellus]
MNSGIGDISPAPQKSERIHIIIRGEVKYHDDHLLPIWLSFLSSSSMNTSYDESTGGGFVGGSSVELKTPSRSRRAGNNPPTWYVAQNEQTYFDPNHVPPPQSVMGGPIPQSERIGGEYFAPGGLVTQAPRKATGLVLNRPDGKSGIRKKMRTSCNLCTKRKKGCDGDGVTACSWCIASKKECIYSERPKRAPRDALASLKRVKISPSSATGLPWKQESRYIGNFFDKLGFFPLSSERLIRRVLDKLEWMNPHDGNAGIPSGSDSADVRGKQLNSITHTYAYLCSPALKVKHFFLY